MATADALLVLDDTAEHLAESLRELVAMGVDHLQVRSLSRSVDELCDRAGFAKTIMPLVQRWARSALRRHPRYRYGSKSTCRRKIQSVRPV